MCAICTLCATSKKHFIMEVIAPKEPTNSLRPKESSFTIRNEKRKAATPHTEEFGTRKWFDIFALKMTNGQSIGVS